MRGFFFIFAVAYCQYISDLLATTTSPNVTISDMGSDFYSVPMLIGTPPQIVTLIIDTGANYMWIPSAQAYGNITNISYYSNQSSTYISQNTNLQATYGDYFVSGVVSSDYVQFLGDNLKENFTFALADQFKRPQMQYYYAGLMGLSNDPNTQNIFQLAQANGNINKSHYGLALQANGDSFILYDEIDQTLINSANWLPVQSNSRWEVQILNIYFDYIAQNFTLNTAILDSGTSFIALESDLYNIFQQNISNACDVIGGDIYCSCDPNPAQVALFPTIQIEFNGTSVQMTYLNYLTPISDTSYCSVSVLPLEPGSLEYMILGKPVLQTMIAIFDKESNQVGIVTSIVQPILVTLSSTQLIYSFLLLIFGVLII